MRRGSRRWAHRRELAADVHRVIDDGERVDVCVDARLRGAAGENIEASGGLNL
jgi:hypothetical protein